MPVMHARGLDFGPSRNPGATRQRESVARHKWAPESYEGQVRATLGSWGHSLWMSLGERITARGMMCRGVMPVECAIAIVDVRREASP